MAPASLLVTVSSISTYRTANVTSKSVSLTPATPAGTVTFSGGFTLTSTGDDLDDINVCDTLTLVLSPTVASR